MWKPSRSLALILILCLFPFCALAGGDSTLAGERAFQDDPRLPRPTVEAREISKRAARPIPMILDTDIGTDLDDAYALVLAARSPQIRLLAVTTVYGQVEVRSAIARKLLVLMGEDKIPVASGRPQALDDHKAAWGGWEGKGLLAPNEVVPGISEKSAPDLIVDVLTASQEKVVIVSVGGLTNIAVAMQKNPQIAEKIERFVIMGGCLRPILIQGKRLPDRLETNLHNDVDAAAIVLRSGLPITLVPAEVTFQTNLLQSDFERIRKATTPLAEAMTKLTLIWEPIMKGFLKNAGVGAYYDNGVAMLHDPLAVSTLIDPTLVKIERLRIRVEVEKGSIRTVADAEGPIVIDLVVSADLAGLSRLVTDRVLAESEK